MVHLVLLAHRSIKPSGINSHGSAGNSHSHWGWFPIPSHSHSQFCVLFPFPWDSHRIPGPIGNPIPMHITSAYDVITSSSGRCQRSLGAVRRAECRRILDRTGQQRSCSNRDRIFASQQSTSKLLLLVGRLCGSAHSTTSWRQYSRFCDSSPSPDSVWSAIFCSLKHEGKKLNLQIAARQLRRPQACSGFTVWCVVRSRRMFVNKKLGYRWQTARRSCARRSGVADLLKHAPARVTAPSFVVLGQTL